MATKRSVGWSVSLAALAAVLVSGTSASGGAVTCESRKLTGAGQYAQCALRAEAAFAKSDGGPARVALRKESYQRCWNNIQRSFTIARVCTRLETRDVSMFLGTCASNIAAGRPWTDPGNGLMATGQVTPFGPGSDGELRNGTVHSLVDNGDGTISDEVLGLMWEKKARDGSIHDMDRTFTWGTEGYPTPMDGTMVTEFLVAMNTPPCLGGHCDWRIPNRRELLSIVDRERHAPAVFDALDDACIPGCTVSECSCTAPEPHYSSSPDGGCFPEVWAVDFGRGGTSRVPASRPLRVRAVRDVVVETDVQPVEARLCTAAKLQSAAGFTQCRLAADAVYERSAHSGEDLARLEDARARCGVRIANGYEAAERKYGDACPIPGDRPAVETYAAQCADDVGAYRHFTGLKGLLQTGIVLQPSQLSCGPGSDGDLRTGMRRSFTDNGDGTASDNQTGLVWERKTFDGSVHDRNALFTWSKIGSAGSMDGTMVTQFLAALNTPPCFADHCDWRIPNWNELESIVSLDISYPLVDDGSLRGEYASSTSDAADTNLAWGVDIRSRESVEISKVGTVRVRAVRGG